MACNCPAGIHSRPDLKPITCKHARSVAQLLASRGDAEVRDGKYVLTAPPATIWAEWHLQPVADDQMLPLERTWREAFTAGWEALASHLVASAESRADGWKHLEGEIRAPLADAQRRTGRVAA